MNIIRFAFGHYDTIGDPAQADCIVGHSFGTEIGPGSANGCLAEFILAQELDVPIIVDRMLANAFPNATDVDHIVEGQISNTVGGGLTSWGIWVKAREFMGKQGLTTALTVAQANHIGRVAMQGKKLAKKHPFNIVVPEDLPGGFDPESDQKWTRSEKLWVLREILGSIALRLQGRL